MSFAIASLIVLVIVAVVLIPILIRVFGEAARRNPNRPGGEGRSEPDEEAQRRHSGPSRG
ncbi:hypothetical protein [Rubrobacter xylanophilus]|uniref:hypothetical protein n=1 Tax=Rubrobacter xylanophilus TaxID=49319 RepID=UPI00003A2106|nr:hypothetical protein [Rubrobacter xylanophilus]